MLQFIFTVVFGFLWWWVYTRVGAGLAWLMILGSVLAVCACCCRHDATGGEWRPGDFNYRGWLACMRRCWRQTLVLMFSLFVLGVLVAWFTTGMFPPAADLANILLAAVGAPLFVRAICCAYES
jgi:hypothetical protein